MSSTASKGHRNRGIAFLGTYLPRRCGIATFTYDLAEAVAEEAGPNQPTIIAAMNERAAGYSYPERVQFELRQGYQIDFSRAADFLNYSRIDVVSLQHEFNIFGGEHGSNVLTFIRDLRRPLVVTCHTVRVEEASPAKREVFREVLSRADRIIVMSEKAVEIIEEVYKTNRDKISVIPHGIHDRPFVDPNYYKDKFGVEGRRMLLTFGLLHRNKGIEYMIEALPRIVERHPQTTYVVLGATHPNVVRQEGESYRYSLQRRARELGIEEHVMFHPRFVELDELLEYLGATDILVTPYTKKEHITSGVLAYAAGMGKAVVSTPYWHAEELLEDGRGKLVPMHNANALADSINELLDDEAALSAMRKRAYKYCRTMTWPAIARSYLEAFDEVRSHIPKRISRASAIRRPIAATNVPLPKLDHILRLVDDTGPCRHARHTLPDRLSGYSMEHAAATLVVATKYLDMFGTREARNLAETCLALLQCLVGDGKSPVEGLDHSRNRTGEASSAAIGTAIWAVGYIVARGPSHLVPPANDLFQMALKSANLIDPRGAAYAVLGAANYHKHYPGASAPRRFLSRHAERLASFCKEPNWIERWDGADWGVPVQAMAVAANILEDDELRELAQQLVHDLCVFTQDGTVFIRPGDNPDEEELPLSAATFIEALGAAFYRDRDQELLTKIRSAADWILGANRIGEALYDFSTCGCYDALTAAGLNLNQGTEATVYCVLAFLTLHRLAVANTTPESPSLAAN